MKLKLLIFILVQSVSSDNVPKNGKYAFAYTWSWTTIPTGDGLTNTNASPTPINQNYDLNIVNPAHNEIIPQQNQIIGRPTDNLNSANTGVYYDNRYNPNLGTPQQRPLYPSQDIMPTYQRQQQSNGGLYSIPTNTVLPNQIEDQRIRQSNVGTEETIWYPVVQPNIGNTDQRIRTVYAGTQGTIWYPKPNSVNGNTVILPNRRDEQETIYYQVQKPKTANKNIVILPNQIEDQRIPSGNAGGTIYYRVLEPNSAKGSVTLPNYLEDQKIPSGNEGTIYYRVLQPNNANGPVTLPSQITPSGNDGSIWYPVVQPNRNTLTNLIQTNPTGGLVTNQGYPSQVTGTQPSNTPAIAFAASNIITPSNLQAFLQNPFTYVNSVAYTQV